MPPSKRAASSNASGDESEPAVIVPSRKRARAQSSRASSPGHTTDADTHAAGITTLDAATLKRRKFEKRYKTATTSNEDVLGMCSFYFPSDRTADYNSVHQRRSRQTGLPRSMFTSVPQRSSPKAVRFRTS